MNVAVLGLWHLGSVTAACLARAGHNVVGWDHDQVTVARLASGRAPIAEPDLDALLAETIAAKRLRFTAALDEAVRGSEVVWIAFDTPVDDEDRANVGAVRARVREALPYVEDGALVVCSSQLPVGSVARLERELAECAPERRVEFVSAPENLRLGQAIRVFTQPDRVIAGVRTDRAREQFRALLAPITDRIIWMSVESAEMTKHALNGFLATSVAFINEIAAICEVVGADAKEVEQGLKSDQRIGARAYLSPGGAFAGGTLARDLVLLEHRAAEHGLTTPLLSGVRQSNLGHATWVHRTLDAMLAPLAGRRIAVWGLTYKPGTDTLRRSLSVELCRMLTRAGAQVVAFDPAIREVPVALQGGFTLAADALGAAAGADAVVVGTEWPVFRDVSADALDAAMTRPVVVDPNRFLAATMGTHPRIHYVAVGTPRS